MINKYIKPNINIIVIDSCDLLISSTFSYRENICDYDCTFWHICRDRHIGYFCSDKNKRRR